MKIDLLIDGKKIELSKKTLKSIKKQLNNDETSTNKELSYKDITGNLKRIYFSYLQDIKYSDGSFSNFVSRLCTIRYNTYNQIEHLIAHNELINVAKYLNDKEGGGKFPDWKDIFQNKYYIYLNNSNSICTGITLTNNGQIVYFRSKELAKQARKILGEYTIRKALTLNF